MIPGVPMSEGQSPYPLTEGTYCTTVAGRCHEHSTPNEVITAHFRKDQTIRIDALGSPSTWMELKVPREWIISQYNNLNKD